MIIENFDLAINDVKKLNISKLSKVEKNIKIARDCLFQLRLELRKMDFISTRDEIHFFKKQKPYIHGKLFFYLELNDFLINCPETGVSKQRFYINEQITKLKVKIAEISEFAKYCRLNATKFDQIYFLREDPQLDLFTHKNLEDPEFLTSHDLLASQIVTFNLLMKFYTNELNLLKTKKSIVVIKEVRPAILNNLKWYASKTGFIELLNGLDAKGVFGTPTPDSLKNLINVCEYIFDIDLGNHQKTLNEIKARTKDPTRFMDSLVAALIDRIRFDQKF